MRASALLGLILICGCLDPPPRGTGSGPLGEPERVVVLDDRGPVTMVCRWQRDETIERVGKIATAYRFTTGEEPGLAGSRVSRELRQQIREVLLEGDEAPTLLRRSVPAAVERIVEHDAEGAQARDELGRTPSHGRRLVLRADGSTEPRVPDAVRETLVFDVCSMRALLPPDDVSAGDSWAVPLSALLQIRGRTAGSRTVSGSATARLRRLLEVDGTRVAEVELTFDVRWIDRHRSSAMEYRLTSTLALRGDYWHDLDRGRPRQLRLGGNATLKHEPLTVKSVPLGSERLARPFAAEGRIDITLAFR